MYESNWYMSETFAISSDEGEIATMMCTNYKYTECWGGWTNSYENFHSEKSTKATEKNCIVKRQCPLVENRKYFEFNTVHQVVFFEVFFSFVPFSLILLVYRKSYVVQLHVSALYLSSLSIVRLLLTYILQQLFLLCTLSKIRPVTLFFFTIMISIWPAAHIGLTNTNYK